MNFVTISIVLIALYYVQAKSLTGHSKQNGLKGSPGSQALIKYYANDAFQGYCGGVVLHPRLIFLPLECMMEVNDFQAIVGATQVVDSEVTWLKVDCGIVSSEIFLRYTMGVLVFKNPINGGAVTVATIPQGNGDVIDGENVYVSTYNTYGVKTVIPKIDFDLVNYKGVDRTKCSKTYIRLVSDYQFCYSSEEESCKVDLGSPVYSENGTCIGLTTFRDSLECSRERSVVSMNFRFSVVNDFVRGTIKDGNDDYCGANLTQNANTSGVQLLHL